MGRADDIFSDLVSRGVVAIDEFIATAVSEELFLDFKRSADDGAGVRLQDDDRNNFAKAVSGFGNSEGGVVVWGVDCSRDRATGDVARNKRPIIQSTRFKSLLEGAVSGATVPAHGGVRHHAIIAGPNDAGFVTTLIPSSNHAPHQTVWGGPQYYMRAGSSFLPVPHAVLAGMFGRRPQPALSHSIEFRSSMDIATERGRLLEIHMQLLIHNDGMGIAETIFMNVSAETKAGRHCRVDRIEPDPQSWSYQAARGRQICAISRGIGLAPGAWVCPLHLKIGLIRPIEAMLAIQATYGCAGGPIHRFGFSVAEEALLRMLNKYESDLQDGDGQKWALEVFTEAFRSAMVPSAG